jgi:hypothetical protein
MSRNQKRRTSDQQVALIVVDRVLDLAGPSMYSDCLLDLVYDCLPRMDPSNSFSALVNPPLDNNNDELDDDEKIPIMTDIRENKVLLQPRVFEDITVKN